MTVQELYEKMRVESVEQSNTWDDLDWASGFCDQASDAEGGFLPWSALPESIQAKLYERLTPWLARYDT